MSAFATAYDAAIAAAEKLAQIHRQTKTATANRKAKDLEKSARALRAARTTCVQAVGAKEQAALVKQNPDL